MDFIDQLIRYYESEYKAGYFIGAVVGGVLLTAAILLFKFANPLSLLKGLALPLLFAGIFMGIGGAGSGYYTRQSYAEKLKLYHKDKQAFFKQEVSKTEATHRSWFGIRVWWSIVAGAGVLLMLAAKKNYLMGVGLGLLLFGIIGHIEEAISFRRNERYYKAVLKAAAAGLNKDPAQRTKPADLKEISTDPIKTAVPADLKKIPDTVLQKPDHTAKQKKSTSIPSSVNEGIITSSLIAAAPDDLAVKENLVSDTLEIAAAEQDYNGSRAKASPNFEIGEAAKDRRAGDYNGALLIRKNSGDKKHCWFKKSN